MHKYRITITLPGGKRTAAWGLFASDWHAIDQCLDDFPTAKSITPRRLP